MSRWERAVRPIRPRCPGSIRNSLEKKFISANNVAPISASGAVIQLNPGGTIGRILLSHKEPLKKMFFA